ncbi:MAG: FAD:protein FMN transferase [Candidatus Magasanikbacteria bacterium]
MYWTFGFDAWDTTISGTVDVGEKYDESTLADLEQQLKADAEMYAKICSRFDNASEISQLNEQTDNEVVVSERLSDMLEKAQKTYRETHGIFDPTILKALEHSGYDKTFLNISDDDPSTHIYEKRDLIVRQHAGRPQFSEIRLHKDKHSVYMPLGMRIDLMGIAKGYWVDYAVEQFFSEYQSLWLSAGGDIYVKGMDEKQEPWKIIVQDPFDLSNNIGYFTHTAKKDFGVATSGITKRMGMSGAGKWHHIIDPRTGLPSESDVVSATVCAPSVADADVYAKTAVILGSHQAHLFFLSRPECEYVLVDVNGRVYYSQNLSFRAT